VRRALVALLLLGTICVALAESAAEYRCTGAAGHYKWGNAIWRDEYEPRGAEHMINPNNGLPITAPGGYEGLNGRPYNPTPMPKTWKAQWSVSRWSAVNWGFGQLQITGRADGSDVVMTRKDGAKYGRWESKFHISSQKSKSNSWRVLLELVPADASQHHCGAQTITYGNFIKNTRKGSLQIHTLPNNRFAHTVTTRPGISVDGGFHTFGVEVTKTHVAWFVDDRAVLYEPRKAALHHPKLTLRIRFGGTSDGKFPVPADETPQLGFDWNRFWDLKRPNKLPIKNKPKCAQVTTNPDAC